MKSALWWLLYFCRHPVMRKWPRPYEWFFMKMKVEHIWLQKWYGGVADISREEYFRAVPRKAWWREKKVHDACVKWKPFIQRCQTVVDCCLFLEGFTAGLSPWQQAGREQATRDPCAGRRVKWLFANTQITQGLHLESLFTCFQTRLTCVGALLLP